MIKKYTKYSRLKIDLIIPAFLLILSALIFPQEDRRLHIIDAGSLEHFEIDGEPVEKFVDHVVFRRGTMMLYTNEAIHYSRAKEFHLKGSVKMTDEADTLLCQSLIYFSDSTSVIKAFDDVIFNQPEQIISCDSLFYWPDLDSGMAMSNVQMLQPERQVNTNIFKYAKTNGYRGTSFWAEGETIFSEGTRIIKAHQISYDDQKQLTTLQTDCSISEEDQGLTGDSIEIQYSDSLIETITISGNSYAFSNLDAKIRPNSQQLQRFRNDMQSQKMSAIFENDNISTLQLMGMAVTEYNVVRDTLLHGVNNASGDTIIVSFADGEMNRIQVFGGGRGDFVPEGNNTKVDTTIFYRAEYLDYDINGQQTYLDDSAEVEYQDTKLTAGHIKADWNINILTADKREDILPTVTSIGSEPMMGDFMEFDLISKHGRVIQGKTRFNEGNYYGSEVFRDEPDIFHVDESIYTTCDYETPHFYFASNRMKMVTDDKVIARPLILHIFDIPIFGIPFAVFPNKGGGRHSGWIMPSFGHTASSGTYFQGLGYYWAPNDYLDTKLLLNFRDEKGIDLKGRFNYKKRYKYNGNVNTTIYREVFNDQIEDVFSKDAYQQWKLDWHHSQTIDPTQRLTVNAHYVSDNNINQDYGWDLGTRLDQKLESNANYSKNWPGTKNSLAVSLSESYDLQAANKLPIDLSKSDGDIYIERTRTLPGISFSHGQSQIFGDNEKSKWYHSIYWRFSSNSNSQQKIGLVADGDSLWKNQRDYEYDHRIKHSFSLSSPQTLFDWLTLNPNFRIQEDWVFEYRQAQIYSVLGIYKRDGHDFDPVSDTLATDSNGDVIGKYSNIVYDEVKKFLPRHTGSMSLTANTKIYGIFPANIGKMTALRHVLTPSLTFSWRPDFSKPFFGYDLGYFQEDADGELFDRFAGSTVGGTSQSESQSISFRLNNEFQAKVKEAEDTYKKIRFLTWNMSSSYNAVADSLKLSTLKSSVKIENIGKLVFNIDMIHDPYKLVLVNTADSTYQYKRIDEFCTMPRLTSVSMGTSMRVSGGRFIGFEDVNADTIVVESDDLEDELFPVDINSSIPKTSSDNLWSANLSLRYSLSKNPYGDQINTSETFWANTNVKINLTSQWSVNYNARFDLMSNELVSHSFDFYRSLHCWEFRFQWWPSGVGKGFSLKINVKNPDLKDIKLKSSGGRLSGLW